MNAVNKFLIGVLVILLVILGGLWYWKSSSSEAPVENAPSSVSTPSTAVSPVASAPGARDQLNTALDLKGQKKYAEARDALRRWMKDHPNDPLQGQAETALGEIDIQIIMTPIPAPEKVNYTIQSGDSLARIARKYGTTVELLQKSHHLTSSLIRPGDRLRIYQAKFSVQVNKAENTLTLYEDGKFFKKYRCGTGQYGLTPVGDFKIVDRIPNPAWWKDGKVIPFGDTNNVLGTHWLKLDVPGYGIHGTWEPDSIGKQSSAGCVRLRNEEILELFVLLPYGTPVTIHE